MAMKYRDARISYQPSTLESTDALKDSAVGALSKIRLLMDDLKVADALEVVVELARQANKYIDLTEPFKVFKEDPQSNIIDEILYHLIETSRFIAVLLTPFIPDTSQRILELIQATKNTFDSLQSFDGTQTIQLTKPEVLFERFDFDKKLEEIIG